MLLSMDRVRTRSDACTIALIFRQPKNTYYHEVAIESTPLTEPQVASRNGLAMLRTKPCEPACQKRGSQPTYSRAELGLPTRLLRKVGIMNCWKALFAGAVLLAAVPRAMGANLESKERAAKKACLLGEVDKGAEILADLYVDTNDATYIYNQGRCFEQNGKNDQAVLRFKEYLRKAKNLKNEDRDATLKKIDELQGPTSKHEPQTVPAPASDPALQPSAAPVPTPSATPVGPPSAPVASTTDPLGISQSSPPAPEESPPVYKRWWFWTGIGAVVAGGVVTGVLLSRKSAPQSPACDGLGTCVP
jgi:hypothetical protein